MSYIQCFNVNNYKPSDSLKNLFEELIIQPFNNHSPNQAWETTVRCKDKDYHRKSILDRGRTDFDALFNGLSPEDKVLLYCAYYMPMHLYSSYHIFTKHFLPHITEKIVFIDIGCGPLTSGIAIWAAARQCNITFIGIDRSQVMLNKAMEINNKSNNENRDPFFKDFHRILDYNQLPYYLSCHVEVGDTDDTLIIFNFCYVLASHTFDDDDALNSLIGVINRVVNEHEKHKICVVYQNPVSKRFQENWNYLKSGVITDSSIFNESGFERQDSTKKERFGYENLWGISKTRSVSYDSFNNFSYLENYSDR